MLGRYLGLAGYDLCDDLEIATTAGGDHLSELLPLLSFIARFHCPTNRSVHADL
jgi:hypothetical protein